LLSVAAGLGAQGAPKGAQAAPKGILSANNRITAGKQLGKLNIGDLPEKMKWMKKPDYGDTSSGHQWQTWEARKPDPRNGNITNTLDVYTSVNDDGKYEIRLIRSTSPTFSTTGKVKVGTPFAEVKKQYGKIAKVADYESPQFAYKVALFDDEAEGIAFEFKTEADGNVSPKAKCLSIWVHEPGLNLLKEYYPPVEYIASKPILRRAAKKH
jgi:hypothetical protein